MTSRQLPEPPQAASAKSAIELARIWAIDGEQHVTLATGLWDDPAAWGLMLADFAKHVADAYKARGIEPESALKRIRDALNAEWDNPTS